MYDPFDRLLNGMLPFHNHFRHAHAMLMRAVPLSQTASRLNLQSLVHNSLGLCKSLEMHHKIEETYIFPLLAPRLPSFGTENPIHIREHEAMHEKLEVLQEYSESLLRKLQSREARELEASGVGKEMAGELDEEERKIKPWPFAFYDASQFESNLKDLASVLFPHLEAEEKTLKASNLKDHGMTLQELQRIPM